MRSVGQIADTPVQAVNALETVYKKSFLAFIKVFDSDLSSDDSRYYYAEKEWRRLGNLGFETSNVVRVVVAPGYVKRLTDDLPQYAGKVSVLSANPNVLRRLWLSVLAAHRTLRGRG